MLRTIEYTFSAQGITPFSPQFAGIQGENGATELVFLPDEEFADELTVLGGSYDTLYYRFDCVDGAGRTVTGTALEYTGEDISLTLDTQLTEAGGKLRVCLIISGENNGEESGTRLFTFPAELYFKDFPLRMSFTERGDLNHAVKQVGEMRQEVYGMVLSAQSACSENSDLAAQVAADAQSAASYAATALTNAMTASGYSEEARSSAEEAADALAELLALVGDINAILDTLVNAA